MSIPGLAGWRMKFGNDWRVFRDKLGAQTPQLLQVGKPPPKCVLCFAGSGHLVTYQLGVAAYLHQEKQQLLCKSYFLGAGSGSIAAAALACGSQVNFTAIRDQIINNAYSVEDTDKHQERMKQGIERLMPRNAHQLMNGRVAIALGPSNRDAAWYEQPSQHKLNGWHISSWKDEDDVAQCLIAASNSSSARPIQYRGCPCTRSTWVSLSSELDPYVRHIHIYGYCGQNNKPSHAKHRVFIDRHGYLSYTGQPAWAQFLAMAMPDWKVSASWSRDVLRSAYDAGFHDARRYERWDEEAYFYAKPDRSPSKDKNWRNLRAGLFGSSMQTEL